MGSSSLITNLDGEIVQHIEYVPFGEVFLEERNNTWNTPYLFNAKELDEETGLYYYGARYYDPRTSIWLSTDPLQEKYPNISTYAYAFLNPVKFIDPDGEDPIGATLDALTAFVVEAGMSYIENIVLHDMDPSMALNNVRWKDAVVEAGKSYAISLIFTGTGSVKALSKAANSKMGKIAIEFSANMIGEIVKMYNRGEFGDANGDFSIKSLLKADFSDAMINSLIEALVSQGFANKAAKLEKKFDDAIENVANQQNKLATSLERNASEQVIENRMKKVNQSQKDLLKTAGQRVVNVGAEEVVSNVAGQTVEQIRTK
ncbi:RHS repeat-associated protein [Dysgonomonas sp. PFB1-18]|uniref:RHS repeat domain-containing protein n=1 Tax=unclassified Dysgonomonas TaxID=2630389 RepID=UPI002473A04E|nr:MULTISPECIES: RHS repeat-associated core domain-containing protein [unclassified Dysgonomonas]MDH6310943.1 RHS repeat-associated protein [Dysgonomonas sp. PF1-14]MDH6340842.1 RHS repeat-associated protein [Dysgonomonas sp. PF1-16]MDH6382466.1 RHS repeat-associated protein [Dysgonomonas sp. PFB1-18]MDH6399815.1 RHS repeat-associated protein [Dysgonomonas sp. PF1-23]